MGLRQKHDTLPPYNKSLQRTVIDRVVRHEHQRAGAEPGRQMSGLMPTAPLWACCEAMQQQIQFKCRDHAELSSDCPDSLAGSLGASSRFRIRVHDRGSSFVEIRFCPWCGFDLTSRKNPTSVPADRGG
jgi:hypothetical protein